MEQGRQVGALGEFFVVDVDAAVDPADGAWRPLADLVEGDALATRVAATRAALAGYAGGEVEPRVAASTTSLGLFARLLSPALGAALLDVAGPEPAALLWREVAAGPLPLRATRWSPSVLDATLHDVAVPLARRLEHEHSLSGAVVRGNLASAVVGSLRMAVVARPDLAASATALADRLLASPLLDGTSLTGWPFVRRSCCLYYRVPGGGYCGDCVLAPQHRDRVAAERRV